MFTALNFICISFRDKDITQPGKRAFSSSSSSAVCPPSPPPRILVHSQRSPSLCSLLVLLWLILAPLASVFKGFGFLLAAGWFLAGQRGRPDSSVSVRIPPRPPPRSCFRTSCILRDELVKLQGQRLQI